MSYDLLWIINETIKLFLVWTQLQECSAIFRFMNSTTLILDFHHFIASLFRKFLLVRGQNSRGSPSLLSYF